MSRLQLFIYNKQYNVKSYLIGEETELQKVIDHFDCDDFRYNEWQNGAYILRSVQQIDCSSENSPHHQMQIIKLPRLSHTVVAEPVKAHNIDLRFVERIAVVGNMIQQRIKLLFCAMPVKRFGKFHQNRVTSAFENIIKYSVILPFCVLRDVKRQFLYAFGELLLQCKFIKL